MLRKKANSPEQAFRLLGSLPADFLAERNDGLAHKLIPVTNNVTEFERVPGLRVESWVGQ